MSELNLNRANYYSENQKLKDVISQQKLIIAQLEKDLSTRAYTVDYLTIELNKLNCKNTQETDLLNFD